MILDNHSAFYKKDTWCYYVGHHNNHCNFNSANKVEFSGFSPPPSLAPVLFELDFSGALNVGIISVVLTFLFVNLFDTAGTLLAVATSANLIDDKGKLKILTKL